MMFRHLVQFQMAVETMTLVRIHLNDSDFSSFTAGPGLNWKSTERCTKLAVTLKGEQMVTQNSK